MQPRLKGGEILHGSPRFWFCIDLQRCLWLC